MRFLQVVIVSGTLVLFFGAQNGESTLMLTSMLLAAKTGMMLGKMGVGGMLMMLLAASNEQNHNNPATAYGKRTIRSADAQDKGGPRNETEELVVRQRLVRQMDSAFDTMTCLPKFVCGINAQTPSKKTSLMNDYSHLLKVILLPEELEQDDGTDDSDELVPRDAEETRLADEEKERVEDWAHDQLIEDDPGMLPFVLKEVIKRKSRPPGDSQPFADYGPPRHALPMGPQRKTGFSPLSAITSFLPKVEAGFGTKSKDSDFDSDPFFAGFKRSLESSVRNLEAHGIKEDSVSIVGEEAEAETALKPMTRRQRAAFVKRMRTKLSKVTDPLDKYKIAEEVGRQVKNNKDACDKVFKKCPYKWEEVMGMVGNLKNVITAHPVMEAIMDPNKTTTKTTTTTGDKVVFLKATSGSSGNKTMVMVGGEATGSMDSAAGTTVIHDLGNGNMVQISMKVMAPMVMQNASALGLGTVPSGVVFPDDDVSPATPSNPTDADLLAAALSFQQVNQNGTYVPKRKRKPIPNLPFLTGGAPVDFTVDDEHEDFQLPLKPKGSADPNAKNKSKKYTIKKKGQEQKVVPPEAEEAEEELKDYTREDQEDEPFEDEADEDSGDDDDADGEDDGEDSYKSLPTIVVVQKRRPAPTAAPAITRRRGPPQGYLRRPTMPMYQDYSRRVTGGYRRDSKMASVDIPDQKQETAGSPLLM